MAATSSEPTPDQNTARKRLTRDWLIAAALALAVLAGMGVLLATQWVTAAVGRWAIISGLAIFYELRVFRQTLPVMHPLHEKTLADGLGRDVWMTLLSGLAWALLAGFLLISQPEGLLGWLPGMLAAIAIIAALLSGRFRRRQGAATVGGMHLAREFQALGTLIITVMAIHYGKLNVWLMIFGIMDYVQLFTISWLGRRDKKWHQPPTRPRHFLQGIYLAAISITLWPVVPPGYAVFLGLIFGLPYFLISLRDWFILTGLLDPERSQYRQATDAISRALGGWLAMTFRLLGAMATATIAADVVFHFDVYAAVFPNALSVGAVALMLLVALPFLFLGIRARIFALIAFIALSIILLVMGENTVILISLLLTGLTIILGQGKIALETEDAADPATH
jgi:hypothetical protein